MTLHFRIYLVAIFVPLMAAVHLPNEATAAGNPVVEKVTPLGGTRGSEFTLTLRGYNLRDVSGILFYRPGLSVSRIESNNDGQVVLAIRSDTRCPLGEHPWRLQTKHGLGDVWTLRIGPFRDIPEKEPNNEIRQAQVVSINTTVSGIIDEIDVDSYIIEASQGERISVEVEGLRLGTELFDPHVSIVTESGEVLAAVDDTPLLGLDTFASIIAPRGGRYVVRVRESAYGGGADSRYRVHIGNFVRPSAVYPAGGQVGEELTVKLIDPARDEVATVRLPDEPTGQFPLFANIGGMESPSPNRLRVSPFPNVLEREPNDDPIPSNDAVASIPVALNGIISQRGDVDAFAVRLAGGTSVDIQIHAQRLSSPLDPILTIFDKAGNRLLRNDDQIMHDSVLRFHAPADGTYVVQVEDQLRDGGANYVYRVEVTAPAPAVTVTIPEVRRHSQEQQSIIVPRGNRFAAQLAVLRSDVQGDVVLQATNLPPGVRVAADAIPADRHLVPVLFEAAADAPLGAHVVDITGSISGQTIESRFEQVVPLVKGRGQVYRGATLSRLAIAVVEEAPFKLMVEQPLVPLVKDGEIRLKIRAERNEGFDGLIKISLPFQPPFVERPNEEAAEIQIPPGKTETEFPLIATEHASTQSWKLVALGAAEIGDGTIVVASDFITLSIKEPYVSLNIKATDTEVGRPITITGNVQSKETFSGDAVLRLKGLPKGAETRDVNIRAGVDRFEFPVNVTADTTPGIHNTLYCELDILENGQTVRHFLGRGGLLNVRAAGSPPKETISRLAVLRRDAAAKRQAQAKNSPDRVSGSLD